MEAFLIPAGVIALAELGDKSQLLAFLLAAKYRAPLPIIGLAFLGVAAWMLLPEKEDAEIVQPPHYGPFIATVLTLFLAEMGDKTQVATMAMVAHFQAYLLVIAGTTTGMVIANVPAVYIGDRMSRRLPTRAIGIASAFVFGVLGLLVITGLGERLGI